MVIITGGPSDILYIFKPLENVFIISFYDRTKLSDENNISVMVTCT